MRIGVDLGGTKIEAVLLNTAGEEVLRRRIATPRGEYAKIVEVIVRLVRGIEADCNAACSVGVGIPGAVSRVSAVVKNANSTELNGHALDQDLSAELQREVRIANDANCFALSEAVDGAASQLAGETPVVFGVILGTGVGGGLVVGNQCIAGADGIAGEWGHNELPWRNREEIPGLQCWCGKFACIETFLSGPGLALDHESRSGDKVSAKELTEQAASGNAGACHTLELYEHRLARGLASIINVLNPDAIVLGGGVSNIERLYENVPKLWSKFVFSDAVSTRLLRAQHGDSSGVRGAAWLHPR